MRYQKINSQKMKEINIENVLSIVRKYGVISRKDLVKKTELTTGTITNLITELLESCLLYTSSGKWDFLSIRKKTK